VRGTYKWGVLNFYYYYVTNKGVMLAIFLDVNRWSCLRIKMSLISQRVAVWLDDWASVVRSIDASSVYGLQFSLMGNWIRRQDQVRPCRKRYKKKIVLLSNVILNEAENKPTRAKAIAVSCNGYACHLCLWPHRSPFFPRKKKIYFAVRTLGMGIRALPDRVFLRC
jgi:hypothetical protein